MQSNIKLLQLQGTFIRLKEFFISIASPTIVIKFYFWTLTHVFWNNPRLTLLKQVLFQVNQKFLKTTLCLNVIFIHIFNAFEVNINNSSQDSKHLYLTCKYHTAWTIWNICGCSIYPLNGTFLQWTVGHGVELLMRMIFYTHRPPGKALALP